MRARTAAAAGATGLAVLLGGGSALTQANTVDASKAGQGVGAVSGYVVSGVEYGLDSGANGDRVLSVAFVLDAAAETVRARLVTSGGSGDYRSCTVRAGVTNGWTCAFSPSVAVSTVTGLDVVAVDSTS